MGLQIVLVIGIILCLSISVIALPSFFGERGAGSSDYKYYDVYNHVIKRIYLFTFVPTSRYTCRGYAQDTSPDSFNVPVIENNPKEIFECKGDEGKVIYCDTNIASGWEYYHPRPRKCSELNEPAMVQSR